MRLLGISAGRKLGNSEILLKEALMAAEESGGIEVEIVRLHDLKIKFCTGCEICTQMGHDNPEGGCIIRDDDMSFLKEKLGGCDGLIISSPTFLLRPPGIFMTMNERFLGFGPKFLMDVYKRKMAGAAISVGGTDWIQMALPMMMMPFFMLNICVVDKMQAMWSSSSGHVLLYEEFIERAAKLGRNVAEAMKKRSTDYMGDDKGICPYCRSNLLLTGTKSVVTCPLCDIKGDLILDEDRIRINWREEDIKKVRWEPLGMGHHFGEIEKNHAHFEKNKELVKQRLEKYRSYKSYSRP